MKICYFGIYNSDESRNRIYMKGFLESGVEILECRDQSRGPIKYFKLASKHWSMRDKYDFLIVGYPGHSVVWLAKLLSSKPVIFDALCTMEEGVVLSRGQRGFLGLKALYVRFVDYLAVKMADIVLVESESQKRYFEAKFNTADKIKVVYTGADDSVFYIDPSVKKQNDFTVVFRGKFLVEAGVKYIIEAAKILADQHIEFLIIGNGWMVRSIKSQVESYKLNNLKLVTRYLSHDELRATLLSCHVSLGQFESHERLKRTIPHKCFESLALGLPYVTAKSEATAEILKEGENCLFVNPSDPTDLADKLLLLKSSEELREKMSKNNATLFEAKFAPNILADQILDLVYTKLSI